MCLSYPPLKWLASSLTTFCPCTLTSCGAGSMQPCGPTKSKCSCELFHPPAPVGIKSKVLWISAESVCKPSSHCWEIWSQPGHPVSFWTKQELYLLRITVHPAPVDSDCFGLVATRLPPLTPIISSLYNSYLWYESRHCLEVCSCCSASLLVFS